MKADIYVLLPFVAWFIAGSLKFIINSIRFKGEGLRRIGNGGFPSTHTSVVTSIATFLGMTEGFASPYFLIGETVALITIIDAIGIRRAVGYQAQRINEIDKNQKPLRILQGHKPIETLGGGLLELLLGM